MDNDEQAARVPQLACHLFPSPLAGHRGALPRAFSSTPTVAPPTPTAVAPPRLLPRADRRRSRRTPGSAPVRRPPALPHADAQRSMAGRSGTRVALLAATGGGDGRAGSASAAAT